MNPDIFKKYDIRGIAEGEEAVITPSAVRLIGQGFGTYLQRFEQKFTVVVGRDNRRTSYSLSRALIEGLKMSGCKVIDLDLVPTPVVYWNAVRHDNAGGVVITGSHLSPDQNGAKLCVGNKSIYGSQLKLIRGFIDSGDLTYGAGELEFDRSSYTRYVKDIAQRITMGRSLKIVIDAGNGTGGMFSTALMRLWGHEVLECLYCQPDGNFPNHPANPQETDTLEDLSARVVELGADIGIAFDGDVDRMGVVDEKGQPIAADRILTLLARDMLSRHPGSAVVADVLSSRVLFDEVARAGGQPIMWASGHSLVKAKMAESKALLGGEMSGHIFFGEDYFGFDDGFFASGRVLQLLSNSDQTLSELDQTLPRYFSTPEYRPLCPDELKHDVINKVRIMLSDRGEVTAVDGVRINFERGWGLLRASNTEPVLSLRFEGTTEEDAVMYRDIFVNALRQFREIDHSVFAD